VRQIRLNPVVDQNVVSYDVVIGVPNPDLRLMPGMTATLSIVTAHKDDVLRVPAAALRFSPPGAQAKGTWTGARGAAFPESGRAGDTARAAASHRGGTGKSDWGRVWVLEAGSPKPVKVRVGLSDGAHTEVEGPLSAGQDVVIGTETGKSAGASQGSPFGMSRGGRGRFH
jgi:HlyD family secretion protein